jgi:hypothetical protein
MKLSVFEIKFTTYKMDVVLAFSEHDHLYLCTVATDVT